MRAPARAADRRAERSRRVRRRRARRTRGAARWAAASRRAPEMRERGRVCLRLGRVGRDDRDRERPGARRARRWQGRSDGGASRAGPEAAYVAAGGGDAARVSRNCRRRAVTARVGDRDPPRPAARAARRDGESPPRSTSAPGSTGHAARIAARARVAEKPLPIPPRSTAAPGSSRARPAACRARSRARAPAGGRGRDALELLEAAVVAGGDEGRQDRRVEAATGLLPCPPRAASARRRGRLDPVAGGGVKAREVAGRVEAGERTLARFDLGARRGERAPGSEAVGVEAVTPAAQVVPTARHSRSVAGGRSRPRHRGGRVVACGAPSAPRWATTSCCLPLRP